MVFIWIIPCAVAQNIETIIVARFFDGMAGSVFLSVAGGTVGDMFIKEELSMPMMVYSGSPFIGPAIGPIIGGFINQYTDWRCDPLPKMPINARLMGFFNTAGPSGYY